MALSLTIIAYSGGTAEDSHLVPFFQTQRGLSYRLDRTKSIDCFLFREHIHEQSSTHHLRLLHAFETVYKLLEIDQCL